jgi:hypothetical protein
LYDNDSTDAPRRVLQPFIARNIVTLKRWPGAKTDKPTPQSRSLKDCQRVARRRRATWLAAFDIDEFLVLRGGAEDACVGAAPSRLHAALGALEARGVGAVIVERLDFGTSGLASRGGRLATAAFTQRHANASRHGKPLVLVRALKGYNGFHLVDLQDGWPSPRGCGSAPLGGCALQLFHHKTRSREECEAKAGDARLSKNNWRRRAGLAQCARGGYTVHDAALANSSAARCVADNAQQRRRGAVAQQVP